MTNHYVSSVGYTAVAAWQAGHAYVSGSIVRQLAAPAVGNERCFRTANGGSSGGSEPAWVLTAGASSPTDGSITDWTEVTGQEAYQASNAWRAPHARLSTVAAAGWAAAGDDVYVSQDHNATQATALLITWQGTVAAPVRVICVNRGVGSSVPPVSADLRTPVSPPAAIETVSGAVVFAPCNAGVVFFRGLSFIGSNAFTTLKLNAGASGTSYAKYLLCTASLSAGGSSSNTIVPASTGCTDLEMVTINLSGSGQRLSLESGHTTWRGGTVTGVGTSGLFAPGGNGGGSIKAEAIDCTSFGAGKALADATRVVACDILLTNCKLNAAVATISGPVASPGCPNFDMQNCDSGATTYRAERQRYQGSVQTETTVVRSGGFSDGTTVISDKYVTSAAASYAMPLDGFRYFYWRDDTLSHTVTLDIVNDGLTLKNDDVRMEVSYMGDAGDPLGTFVSSGKGDLLAVGSPLASSNSSTWTTTGLSAPVRQKLVTPSFTPAMKGMFQVVVRVGRPSTTVYVDPLLQIG